MAAIPRTPWDTPEPPPHPGPEHVAAQDNQERAVPGAAAASRSAGSKLNILEPVRWAGLPVPERRWLVPGLIPLGAVTLLSGDGGLGKSLSAMQLTTACATGRKWLGLDTMTCRAFAIHCEDDVDELRIRQAAINRAYGLDFGELEDLQMLSRVGDDNVLIAVDKFGKSTGKTTPFFDQVRRAAKAFGAQCVVFDSLHDLFAGNENSRPEARGFVNVLRGLALELDAAVVLLAHPSVSGMTNGTGSSGSTAWNAAVRSRLYMTRPKGDDVDPNVRELRTMKANYGGLDRPITMRWQEGIFVAEGSSAPRGSPMDRITTDADVLKGLEYLITNGAKVAASHAAKNGLAPTLKTSGCCKSLSRSDVMAAQDRLIAAGKIVRVELGPPSGRVIYIRPADLKYPGEKLEDLR